MNCTNAGCAGQYEARKVLHTVRHQGKVVVIEDVPAEVCAVCGDVLFAPETVRHIERLLATSKRPAKRAALYAYA